LTGQSGGKIRQELRETDVHICVPSDKAVRIQGSFAGVARFV